MCRRPCAHRRNELEILYYPRICPPLSPPTRNDLPPPRSGRRPLLLIGPLLTQTSLGATAPAVVFYPESFRGSPAKTPPADPPASAPLTTTVAHRRMAIPQTAAGEPGIVERSSPLFMAAAMVAVVMAWLSQECHQAGSLALVVIIMQETKSAPPLGCPRRRLAAALPFSLAGMPEMRALTRRQA